MRKSLHVRKTLESDLFEDHCWKDLMSLEIVEIYKAYKRETYIGKRPALLAIDLYRKAFQGGPKPVHEVTKTFPSSCGVYAWNAVKPIQTLFAMVRSAKFPVLYTTTASRKGKSAGVTATQRQLDNTDLQGYEILDKFKPDPEDIIIYKERASGFFGTPLVAHLVTRDIDALIICGESTSGCVRATVVDAYSYGFHVVVVEDCCFDRSLLSHKVSLFDMHHKYADVMNLNEVKKHLHAAK